MSLKPADWHRRYSEQARWTADLRRHLLEQVRLPPAPRMLEVGCGTGAVLAELLPPPPPASPSNLPHLAAQNGGGQGISQLAAQNGGDPCRGAATLRPYPECTEQAIEEDFPPPSPIGRRTGGAGGLFGLDISLPSLRLAAAHAPAARLACADAHLLPFPPASFDLVCCHFLLLWVSDPGQVLHEIRRITRPGGAVLAFAEPDYGGRVDYPSELAQTGAWQAASLRAQGADPQTGRRLAGLFAAAGLAQVQVGVLGGQWQPQTFDPAALESEWQVIASDLAALPGAPVSPSELARLHRLDEAARRRGERILFVPTFYAWGVAP